MDKLSLGLAIGNNLVGCSICGKLLHVKDANRSRYGSGRFYCKYPDAEHKAEAAKILAEARNA